MLATVVKATLQPRGAGCKRISYQFVWELPDVTAVAARLATAAVLPNTPTYANGAAGVGATLTAGANSTLTVDGVVANLADRVLVKNQAAALQNGIYVVTAAGSGAAPWVLTRATDCDQAAEVALAIVVGSTAGSTLAGRLWLHRGAVIVMGTDAIAWEAGEPTGTVTFQISNSCKSDGTGGTFETLAPKIAGQAQSMTAQPAGSASTGSIAFELDFRAVQFTYAVTSGSGKLTAYVLGSN